MNLKAKPIVKNQYWVVTDGEKKVGNVVAEGNGYELKINGNSQYFTTTKAIEKNASIEFETLKKPVNSENLFSEYPTPAKIYNSLLDVKRKLHLFTKTAKSKCYHAAGWFSVQQNGEYEVIFCPKYIFVQRYAYHGPFKTENEAKNSINTV
jgi:hypothetical protein